MRILHCVASVNPTGGGPIEGIKRLGDTLPSYGSRSEILSLDRPSDPWVRECSLTVHAVGPNIGHYRYNSRFVPWLKANADAYDVVVINGMWQYSSFGTWRALRQSTTPYVVFPHGMLDPWFKHRYPLKHLKKWLYWPWAEYRVLRDAAAVVFTCDEERVLARQSFGLYSAVERVVAYGTADPVLTDAQRERFLEQFPVLRRGRYLLFLSRIHPKKGCDLLLEAFAAVHKGDPDLRVAIAGPDATNWRRDLERLASTLGIADRVVWTGPLSGDMKWGAFQGADAFVLPSHQENFGIAVAEALACGLPVLVTDKVNIWREIAEDGAGLIGTDDVEGITGLLRTWANTKSESRKDMSARARQTFLKRFEITDTAKSLLQILESVIH